MDATVLCYLAMAALAASTHLQTAKSQYIWRSIWNRNYLKSIELWLFRLKIGLQPRFIFDLDFKLFQLLRQCTVQFVIALPLSQVLVESHSNSQHIYYWRVRVGMTVNSVTSTFFFIATEKQLSRIWKIYISLHRLILPVVLALKTAV